MNQFSHKIPVEIIFLCYWFCTIKHKKMFPKVNIKKLIQKDLDRKYYCLPSNLALLDARTYLEVVLGG